MRGICKGLDQQVGEILDFYKQNLIDYIGRSLEDDNVIGDVFGRVLIFEVLEKNNDFMRNRIKILFVLYLCKEFDFILFMVWNYEFKRGGWIN